MAAAKAERSAHPVCSCVTSPGKYYSTQCEAMEKTPDIDCACGHTGGKGKTSEEVRSAIGERATG